MSRFPKLTETFILYEMLALEKQGLQIELYPLLRERTTVMHAEAVPLVARANFQPLISWSILRAHLYFWRRKPRAYLGALWSLLSGTWGSFRYFTGALGLFPKTVYFAHHMAAENVSHVHAHFASHPAAAAFVIHRLVGIPYSFTAHGSDLHRDRHMLCQKVAEAAFVVPISAYNRQMILNECKGRYSDKLIVIHCGVDPQIFQPCLADGDGQASEALFTILCIGTLHEVKGQTYLIEACRLLQARGMSFACHFVGDGPDRAALTEQVSETGLLNLVHFHGRQSRAEVARFLQSADVVVAPSVPSSNGRREGIPVVLMEAMASGVPVIASRMTGIPELVTDGQNGFLTQPGDAKSLADVLERLGTDQLLRRRLGQAGREKVMLQFNVYTNAAALAQHFRRKVSKKNHVVGEASRWT